MIQVRTTAPSSNNKYYLRPSKGGVNNCIEIKNGSVLPNCVGYAHGAILELSNGKYKTPMTNAETFYNNASSIFKRGSTPKVGAVACWRKGSAQTGADGAGHVAIVTSYTDSTITVAQSNYSGKRWEMKTYNRNSLNFNGLTFQGYLYYPEDLEQGDMDEMKKADGTEVTTQEALYKMAEDVLKGMYGNGSTRKERLYKAIQAKVNELCKK